VTPLGKVTQVLSELIEKGKTDMHDEKVRFTSLQQWCKSTSGEKLRTIEAAAHSIDQRTADALKANADAESLGKDIDDLDGKLTASELEGNNAKSIRKSELDEYTKSHQDMSDAIDAVERALATLRSRKDDVPQAVLMQVQRASALAVSRPGLAEDTRKAVLLATAMADAAKESYGQTPRANAYEFQSGTVVELLESLHERFQDERLALEKDETNKKYSHNLFMQKLEDTQTAATATRAEKATAKAQAMEDHADATSDVQELTRGKLADEGYLREARAVCEQKSSDFHSRQKLRAEELEALAKAYDLISSEAVTAPAATYLPKLLQGRSSSSAPVLAQLSRGRTGRVDDDDPTKRRQIEAASLLARRAKDSGSKLLATLAQRSASSEENPFSKVKQMIADLLARLQEEADQEASHKEWCDQELAANEKTRKEETAEAASLTARAEELTALEAKLGQKIQDLTQEISELDASVAEATKERNEEKGKNAKTVQEAKDAQAAVMQAIHILKGFYGKAADATAFAQQPSEGAAADAPFVFKDAYTGMQGENTGVMGLLEVVHADFARLEADTSAAEATAKREYAEFTEVSAKDKAEKEAESRQTGFQKVRTTRDLTQTKSELEMTQKELDAALEYYENLKPSCIGEAANYGDRVAMREAEIESLKEALRVLEGETTPPAA
jgi:DNA repair exonuclease SbcCD ATPase subunit